MNPGEEIMITYDFKDRIYNVNGSSVFHQRLQDDSRFCEQYFGSLKTQFPDQGNKENIGDNPKHFPQLPLSVTRSSDCPSELITSNLIDDNPDEFKWTRQATLLLLNLYKEKNYLFRNSKIKNKDIWLQILKEFHNRGYKSVTIELLDRKMRNLKKTYKDNKDKKNKTGESAITWEYFETMDDIFFNDKTINPTSIISTMESVLKDSQATLNFKTCPTIQMSEDPSSKVENIQKQSIKVSMQDQNPKVDENKQKETDKVRKANRTKQLYDHRKKIQEIESQRLEEVKKLREALERNNEIQQERNQILKQILEK